MNDMQNKTKSKLKRRGLKLYNKYFFNSDTILETIIKQIDNNLIIDENICDVIINCSDINIPQIYELIKYYPNKLKEIKYITDEVITDLYNLYGLTIEIMNNSKNNNDINFKNVRGKICDSARKRSKEKNIEFNITNEDIILIKVCPLLNIPLEYGNNKQNKNSASIDRIDSSKGYVKGNIQIISSLANSMKNSASNEELITFATNVLKLYK